MEPTTLLRAEKPYTLYSPGESRPRQETRGLTCSRVAARVVGERRGVQKTLVIYKIDRDATLGEK